MGANHRGVHRRCDRAARDVLAHRPGALVPASQRGWGFLAFASIALALTAARRLDNALVSWTDVMDLPTYSLLAKFMWMPAVAAWALAWNRWRQRPWKSIDASAVAIMVAQIVGAVTPSASVTSVSRLAAIALFVVIAARIVRGGAMRIHAPITLAFTVLAFFGGELLDPIGVPGIWFPFGIGVSRTQYILAIFIPGRTSRSPAAAAIPP
jgi:hypothetical protein